MRARRIATHKSHAETLGDIAIAAHKLRSPILADICRQGNRQQRCDRTTAHGRNITEIDRKRFRTYLGRRGRIAQKMDALVEHIGGKEERFAITDRQHGTIVAYPLETVRRQRGKQLGNGGYKTELRHTVLIFVDDIYLFVATLHTILFACVLFQIGVVTQLLYKGAVFSYALPIGLALRFEPMNGGIGTDNGQAGAPDKKERKEDYGDCNRQPRLLQNRFERNLHRTLSD